MRAAKRFRMSIPRAVRNAEKKVEERYAKESGLDLQRVRRR
jgi:hypothetical protein